MGITATPATASPIENEIILSQVGVRRGITPPIPLNLRPRIHIPSPPSNYRHNYSRYNYHRHHSDYGNYRHPYHRRTHRKRRSHPGTVIIISPGNYSNYSNYGNNGYIRVIRK